MQKNVNADRVDVISTAGEWQLL